ncbi:MATH domain and coiled-coil domain-containing protein At3g58270 [Gossypium raimondii]|uniref:MATH domain-containing protein n=1 Tax=Gossypium raimondii TaxID=29730 RepID=A0A0D2UWR2_GOSRA|nr:MATH domain and coiled-coil domain-containing protein At3g58270 [Gossypium raimondii]KJB73319.1 hypothetical protein B456_011G227600 [Gossypium raimondii]
MDVNGLITKVTWKIEVLSDVGSKSMGLNRQLTKVTWRIENFSSIKDYKLCSESFTVDDSKWQLIIYPRGNNVGFLSIFLRVADSAALASGWTRYAHFGFAVIDQFDRENSKTLATKKEFNANYPIRGFGSFLPLTELRNPKRGYLLNDACLVEAYVFTGRTVDMISHEFIVKTDLDKRKTKEGDCFKAAIGNQKTTTTKPVEVINPSPTLAIELEQPAEEDMNTFFTSLESELSSSGIVYSKEEVKEALAKINEALNMTPVDLNDSGKFSPLKQAFMILASFDCSSTTLTIEQTNELLGLEERLKELANRAAKAVQDKNQLAAKESIKWTMTRSLESSLIRYNEVETEVKQVDQILAALHEEVVEAQKKREKMLAERNGIYRSCKEMKMKLDALGKEWAVYEATARVGEDEEKSVEAEWGRIKDFMSSINGKI